MKITRNSGKGWVKLLSHEKFWKRLGQTSFTQSKKETDKVSTTSAGWIGRNKITRRGKWIPGDSIGRTGYMSVTRNKELVHE